MSSTATTTVEIETSLLERLRERSPGKSDRTLIETLATVSLGRDAIHSVRGRFVDADQGEIEVEAVRATREARRELAAERNNAAGA